MDVSGLADHASSAFFDTSNVPAGPRDGKQRRSKPRTPDRPQAAFGQHAQTGNDALSNPDAMTRRLLVLLLLPLMSLCLPPPAGAAGPDGPGDTDDKDDHGAYLSATFGNGRITGGGADGERNMRGRTFELRAGRQRDVAIGATRLDVVHYNEGHPDNNHRDGFALQWLAVKRFNAWLSAEAGAGPYLSMNTTFVDGRQVDDTRWGLLASAALRFDVPWAWPGTHVRLAYNHVQVSGAPRSDAMLLGIGRQFGAVARPDPDASPPGIAGDAEPVWLGVSAGGAITNMAGTNGAAAVRIDARRSLSGGLARWAVSGSFVFEGEDDARVNRRGLAAQLWYRQPVTPRVGIGVGVGPYFARNKHDEGNGRNRFRGNALISLQADYALSPRYRLLLGFSRVKTFIDTNDRDLYLIGVLRAF